MPTSIRVMSFNVRNNRAKDGPNHWDFRKHLVSRTIREWKADVVGTQEVWASQAASLNLDLPEYDYVGTDRDPVGGGEQCGILFKRERFEKLQEGHFWLSETPDVPGSKSWDSSLPRMVTWLKLADRESQGGAFYLFNTHFDQRGGVARTEAARVLLERAVAISGLEGVVITGDFNCCEGDEPYQWLLKETEEEKVKFRDTLRMVHPEASEGEGSFHEWSGARDRGRIDWILVNGHFECGAAEIIHARYEDRYPSDHFPVGAEIWVT